MAVTDLAEFGHPCIVLDTRKLSLVYAEPDEFWIRMTIICDGCEFSFIFSQEQRERGIRCFQFLKNAMAGNT